MRLRKATVQIVRGTSNSDYALTVYMGIKCESGPTYPILLTSLQDLYKYFNSFSKTESFVTAELCLKWGYKVLAHRVSLVTGPSSSRKFIVDDKSRFYSPRYGVDYSGEREITVDTTISYDDQSFSEIFEFESPDEFITQGTANKVNSRFLMIVPRIINVKDQGSRLFNAVLAGDGWSEEEIKSTFNVEASMIQVIKSENMIYDPDHFIKVVLEFCEDICNLSVTKISDTNYTYLLESTTAMQMFEVRNATAQQEGVPTSILEHYISEVGKQDNFCYAYDDYKVATIYSKFPDGINDIQVEITSSYGNYYVVVYKLNSDSAAIYSESFQYSINPTDPNYITHLSSDSELVNIQVHDNTKDLSGTYDLKARTYLDQDSDYITSLSVLEEAQSYQADICLDMDNSVNYVELLRTRFPNAVIFTDSFIEGVKVVNIYPKVTWASYDATLPGFTYLLYILPLNAEGSDHDVIRLESTNDTVPSYVSTITQEDYDVTLMGVDVPLQVTTNRLPVKSVLGVVAIQDLILNSQFESEDDFRSQVSKFTNKVSQYLNCNLYTNVDNTTMSNKTLSATLSFYVDTVHVTSYRITATFNPVI